MTYKEMNHITSLRNQNGGKNNGFGANRSFMHLLSANNLLMVYFEDKMITELQLSQK